MKLSTAASSWTDPIPREQGMKVIGIQSKGWLLGVSMFVSGKPQQSYQGFQTLLKPPRVGSSYVMLQSISYAGGFVGLVLRMCQYSGCLLESRV